MHDLMSDFSSISHVGLAAVFNAIRFLIINLLCYYFLLSLVRI
jgi:hypothetical protein